MRNMAHKPRRWETVLDDLLFLFLAAAIITALCAVDPSAYAR